MANAHTTARRSEGKAPKNSERRAGLVRALGNVTVAFMQASDDPDLLQVARILEATLQAIRAGDRRAKRGLDRMEKPAGEYLRGTGNDVVDSDQAVATWLRQLVRDEVEELFVVNTSLDGNEVTDKKLRDPTTSDFDRSAERLTAAVLSGLDGYALAGLRGQVQTSEERCRAAKAAARKWLPHCDPWPEDTPKVDRVWRAMLKSFGHPATKNFGRKRN